MLVAGLSVQSIEDQKKTLWKKILVHILNGGRGLSFGGHKPNCLMKDLNEIP